MHRYSLPAPAYRLSILGVSLAKHMHPLECWRVDVVQIDRQFSRLIRHSTQQPDNSGLRCKLQASSLTSQFPLRLNLRVKHRDGGWLQTTSSVHCLSFRDARLRLAARRCLVLRKDAEEPGRRHSSCSPGLGLGPHANETRNQAAAKKAWGER